jgi:hypothetical protein
MCSALFTQSRLNMLSYSRKFLRRQPLLEDKPWTLLEIGEISKKSTVIMSSISVETRWPREESRTCSSLPLNT